MKTEVNMPVVVGVVFIWIGFVAAISFMEAWLKFQAPGITLSIGLGIGRLVFGALNKVECLFALVVLAYTFFTKPKSLERGFIWFLVPLIILVCQTFWLLPALDVRAQSVIDGVELAQSNLHLYYIVLEVLKVICLTFFAFSHFKQSIS